MVRKCSFFLPRGKSIISCVFFHSLTFFIPLYFLFLFSFTFSACVSSPLKKIYFFLQSLKHRLIISNLFPLQCRYTAPPPHSTSNVIKSCYSYDVHRPRLPAGAGRRPVQNQQRKHRQGSCTFHSPFSHAAEHTLRTTLFKSHE